MVDGVVGAITRALTSTSALGRPMLISLQLAPQIAPLLMARIAASGPNQCRARCVGVPIQPPCQGHRPADVTAIRINGFLMSLEGTSAQKTSFTCAHMLRMPLSVKSRFRKRPGGEPTTL